MIAVSSKDAFNKGREASKFEGLLVGFHQSQLFLKLQKLQRVLKILEKE
jgi:hypothetical protein